MNRHRETLMKFISEQNQKIQNDISKQGYKDNSPYKNNPFNIIQGTPQGTPITMDGVSQRLYVTDGKTSKILEPNSGTHFFSGPQVKETALAKYGGLLNKTIKCSNCGWSWKAADGGNDVATCHKCGAENKVMQMGGAGMMYADRNYQLGGLKTDDIKRKDYAQKVVALAEERIKNKNYVTDIPQNVRDASAREGKEPYTCIGGVCTVLKDAGVMSNVNWSNTDFAANAKDYGFTANEGWGIKGLQNLEPGDIVQYKNSVNKNGKYYPSHSRIFLGTTPEGEYRFFDNQAQSEQFFDKTSIQEWLDPKKNDSQPNAVIFKVNPYSNTNPFNLTPEEKEKYNLKQETIKFDSNSKKDYDWSISPDAKNYNPDTKRVMDKFISFANDNKKINDLVKKTGRSKKEIQDSLLNVFGELGVENNWTTSKGKGLGSRLENIGESILTSIGGGKGLSVGPGQIKFNNIPADLKEKFNIKTSNDLYDLDKVLPLMAALDLKDKEVLENWGTKNKLSQKLFGFTNPVETEWIEGKGNVPIGDGFTIKDLPAFNNDDSQLNNTVGRYSPYLRNQYSSIANNTFTTGKNDWVPFNEKTSPNNTVLKTDEDTNIKYTRDPGSYPFKVEQNWRNNLNRFVVKNEESAIELPEVVLQKQMAGGITKYQEAGTVKKWLGNTLTPEGYITSTTKGGNRISFTGDQRADEWINKQIDSGKFGFDPTTGGTFPLKKPVKGLSKEDQFIGSKVYYDLQTPEGFNTESQRAQIKNLPEFQQELINAENEKRRKRVVNERWEDAYKNPLFYVPGAIATGGLGLLGLEAAGVAAAPFIQGALATQLPGLAAVPGATVGNAITAGFAGHGLANVGPDTVEMYKNPTWGNAGSLAMDALEIAPIVGPAGKMIGEGVSATRKALTTQESALAKLDDIRNTGTTLETESLNPMTRSIVEKYLKGAEAIQKGIKKVQGLSDDAIRFYRSNNFNISKKAIEDINAGNKWSRDWYSNPIIQKRYDEWITPANRFVDSKTALLYSNLDNTIPGLETINLNKSFSDRLAGTIARNNLEKLITEGKGVEATTSKFLDNSVGRYSHVNNDALIDINHPTFFKKPFGHNYNIKNTTLHEDTHFVTKGDKGFKPERLKEIKEPFYKPKDVNEKEIKNYKYLTKPTEIHARINELRSTFNLTPETIVTDEMVDNIIKLGLKGKTSVVPNFFKLIQDKNGFKNLMNSLPAIVPIGLTVGAGAAVLPTEKQGGVTRTKQKKALSWINS